MVHFDQTLFVSCEDQLSPSNLPSSNDHDGGGVGGFASAAGGIIGRIIIAPNHLFFNPACTATSILLMMLPYQAWRKAHRNLLHAPPIAVAYVAALLHLFYCNLHQHAFSHYIWDLDISGALHSIFLSWMIHEHGGGREALPASISTVLSTETARIAAITAAAAMVALPFAINDAAARTKVAAGVGGVAALTVVPSMGFLSWQHDRTRKRGSNRLFGLWLLSCLGVKTAEWLVKFEQNTICKMNEIVARWFHAIVIHSEIYLLFWAVSECALGLVAAKQHRDIGKKIGKTSEMSIKFQDRGRGTAI